MLTTVKTAKTQLGITDDSQDERIERAIKGVSDAIETYCRRTFSEDFTLPGEPDDPDKPRLPYDVEDACLLWLSYRWSLSGRLGVQSERIDGLGQKTYADQSAGGQMLPAPPAVLALIGPYSNMLYR